MADKISLPQARSILVGEGYSWRQIDVHDVAAGKIVPLDCKVWRTNGAMLTLIGVWPDEISALKEMCKWHAIELDEAKP